MPETSTSTATELESITALRGKGLLTDEEFASQKARILGTPAPPKTPNAADVEAATDEIGDLWVYALLAIPVLAAALVASSFGGSAGSSIGKLFALPNLVQMLLDQGRLKAVGKGLPVWTLVVGLLLIPLYLYFRAGKLGRGMQYVGYYVAELIFLLVGLPVVILLFWQ